MTKQPSPPSSKPASRTGGGKAEGKDGAKSEQMGRFRDLAKKVVSVSPNQIREQEKRERKT